jgi:hypothetical protein
MFDRPSPRRDLSEGKVALIPVQFAMLLEQRALQRSWRPLTAG